jgi:hypothetical protein
LSVDSHMLEGNSRSRAADDPQLPSARLRADLARAFTSRTFTFDLLALSLILLAPLIILLDYHRYAFFTPEVVLIAGVLVAIAALLAIVTAATRPLVRTVLLAGLLTLFIDMHVHFPRFSSTTLLVAFIACFAVLSGLLWLLREHATKIISVVFVTLIGLTVLPMGAGAGATRQESVAGAAVSSDAPLFIHLILDEHIGVDGLPPNIAGAAKLRTDLIDFYTSHGFRLFGRAYSQYANTHNSLANLVNLSAEDARHSDLVHGEREPEWDLKHASYFRELEQRGYQLHIYQSSYMNLCDADGATPKSCMTYPVTSLGTVQDIELPASEKARFIANGLVTRSRVVRLSSQVYERGSDFIAANTAWDLPRWRWEPPVLGPLPVPRVFDRLARDIEENPRGHAFFAHLLVPHYPYVYDRNCTLRSETSDWLANRINFADEFVYNTVASREQRYEHYFEQVRCVMTMLDGLLTGLERRGLLDDATIIVNGDHGSRIPVLFPHAETLAGGMLSERDYIDTFSTLYAIKAPQVEAGYEAQPASLVQLLSHHVAGEPLRDRSSCRVFLGARDTELLAVEPKFCARALVTAQAE